MKKLMFAVAGATMIGGAFAAGPVDGWEAYNFTTTLKTTKGVKANLKAKSNECIEADVTGFVRKQATVKIDGVIWACWCSGFVEDKSFNGFRDYAVDGALFWNTTDKHGFDGFADTAFAWDFINRIDTTAKKTEGVWNAEFDFIDGDGASFKSFELRGAGFGTAAGSAADDNVYIPSMSGYAVGTRWYSCSEAGAANQCGIGEYQYDGYVWSLCDCDDADITDATVAFGSWTLKFNQALANKVAKADGMTAEIFATICKIPAFQAAAAAYGVVVPKTDCEIAKDRLDSYKAELAKLESDVAGYVQNIANYNETIEKCKATNAYLVAEMNRTAETAARAMNDSTNCAWVITYKNASLDNVDLPGKGAADLLTQIEKLEAAWTLVQVETTTPSASLPAFFTTWAEAKDFAQGLTKTATDTAAEAKTAADAVDANTRARQLAAQGIINDTAALEALNYESTKQQLNAKIGTQQAIVDDICD